MYIYIYQCIYIYISMYIYISIISEPGFWPHGPKSGSARLLFRLAEAMNGYLQRLSFNEPVSRWDVGGSRCSRRIPWVNTRSIQQLVSLNKHFWKCQESLGSGLSCLRDTHGLDLHQLRTISFHLKSWSFGDTAWHSPSDVAGLWADLGMTSGPTAPTAPIHPSAGPRTRLDVSKITLTDAPTASSCGRISETMGWKNHPFLKWTVKSPWYMGYPLVI